MKKVFIVGSDLLIGRMFNKMGWGVAKSISDSYDLIQYTGGADVDPSYYGEERHATTSSNPKRDAQEAHLFNQNIGFPQAGICRGGQFLNVMCGGKMWQNVDRHTRPHLASTSDGRTISVTSTHHQMMIPTAEAVWLLSARESIVREGATVRDTSTGYKDCEAVLYPDHRCLCYQPHPEYGYGLNDKENTDYYFECLNRIL